MFLAIPARRVCLALSLALLGACSSMSSGGLEPIDSTQQQLFGDLPLPQGCKLDNRQSLILGGGTGWTGRAVVWAPYGPSDSFIWFRDQLPNAGWSLVSSVKAKTSILVFVRQERTLTLEISEAGGVSSGALMHLTVAPKGGSTPPAGSAKPARAAN